MKRQEIKKGNLPWQVMGISMNIARFLTPKSDVVHLTRNMTLRQAMERMEFHRYKAVPILDEEGHYYASLTEGDILWEVKNSNLSLKECENILVDQVPRNLDYKSVPINSSMESLIKAISTMSFVPVVDDSGYFIGIIKRADVIEYGYRILTESGLIEYNSVS